MRKCTVQDCQRPICGKDLCKIHYDRWKRTGTTIASKEPNGTWQKMSNGYMRGRVNGKRDYQHKHIAEKVLGRPLKGRELVHHVNDDRTDNRHENLVICPNDAYHKLIHRRTRYYATKSPNSGT